MNVQDSRPPTPTLSCRPETRPSPLGPPSGGARTAGRSAGQRALGQRPPPPGVPQVGRAPPAPPPQDVWRVDPATGVVCADAALAQAVVVVVEPVASFATALEPVCAFLGIGVRQVERLAELGAQLRDCRPIAVFREVGSVDCQVYDLLMAVADYDSTLPMLVILDNDFAARGAVDAASRLWQLTAFVCATERPGIQALLDFLFAAGIHARSRP